MLRIQVQLTEEQLEKLRRISAEDGKSVAELVQIGVDLYLQSRSKPDMDELRARAIRAVRGGFSSGLKDLGVNHDKYLAEDFL
jgi:hypothetical protein